MSRETTLDKLRTLRENLAAIAIQEYDVYSNDPNNPDAQKMHNATGDMVRSVERLMRQQAR